MAMAVDFPQLTGRVVDEAHLFDEPTKQWVTETSRNHETKTTNQVVVVTVNSLQGLSEEAYAKQLGNAWGLGQKDKNNGVLILTSIQDRKIRIQVGSGLTSILTNDKAKEIITRDISPNFKKGDYNAGIRQGMGSVIALLEGGTPAENKQGQNSLYEGLKSGSGDVISAILFMLFLPIYYIGRMFGFFKRDGFEGGGSFGDDSGGASGDF